VLSTRRLRQRGVRRQAECEWQRRAAQCRRVERIVRTAAESVAQTKVRSSVQVGRNCGRPGNHKMIRWESAPNVMAKCGNAQTCVAVREGAQTSAARAYEIKKPDGGTEAFTGASGAVQETTNGAPSVCMRAGVARTRCSASVAQMRGALSCLRSSRVSRAHVR